MTDKPEVKTDKLPEVPSEETTPQGKETTNMADLQVLDKLIKPYFESYFRHELEMAKQENEFELKMVEHEVKLWKSLLHIISWSLLALLLLAFYLFYTGRDEYAIQLIVGLALVVMAFIAGKGSRTIIKRIMSDDGQ